MNEPIYAVGIYTTVSCLDVSVPQAHWIPIAHAHDHLNAGRVAKALSQAEATAFSIRIGESKPYVYYRAGHAYDY
jgi:hypothetical protein